MSKNEADGCKKIEASFLKKHGYFQGLKSGTITWTRNERKSDVGIEVSTFDDVGYLRIHYVQTNRDTGEKKDFDYKIPLTTTPCHFGGRRYWFICPMYHNGNYCGRRVGVIYKDGDLFACRHCYDLTYSSRKTSGRWRYYPAFRVLELDTKIEKLEERTKRKTWRGRPTRKQRRLNALYEQVSRYYGYFKATEGREK